MIDVQVTVASLAVADELADALTVVGYPRVSGITTDVPKADGRSTVPEFDHTDAPTLWQERVHASADPGRPARVHVRVDGWPNQQFALLFTDWLRENPSARDDYLATMRAAQDTPKYADAKETWFLGAYRHAWEWADATGWQP